MSTVNVSFRFQLNFAANFGQLQDINPKPVKRSHGNLFYTSIFMLAQSCCTTLEYFNKTF